MYYRFCDYYQLQPFPAGEWQLVRFARHTADGVTSYDTVAGYMSTIKRMHEIGGFPFPQQLHLLKLEMMAIKRELAHLVKKAPPITVEMLLKMYQHIDLSDMLDVVAFAALVVGFTLFLRKSNLVPDTTTTFNHKEQLTAEDITLHNNKTVVQIKWSKTLQYRERELSLPLVRAKNGVICAELWIRRLLLLRHKLVKGQPLFAYKVNGQFIPLTYGVLSKKLKEWVTKIGKKGEDYTLHGLRRGGTNHALTI